MVIEESITIVAPLDRVWKTFTDITCWPAWNTVMKDVRSDSASLEKGADFRFCLRPFMFPVYVEPFIEEVIPNRLVVWSGSKFGIFARHEFIFEESEKNVTVISRESFKGITMDNMSFIFPEKILKELTISLLRDLKQASEHNRGWKK
jgi:hypothetical protein